MKTPQDIAKQIAAANGIRRLDMRGRDSLDIIEISRQSLLDMLVQAVREGVALADSEDEEDESEDIEPDAVCQCGRTAADHDESDYNSDGSCRLHYGNTDADPEACPECGCKPGDEYTPSCDTCQQTLGTLLDDAYGPNATKPPQ